MVYLFVRSAATFVDEGFDTDAVWLKGMFCEVDELITHFIVTCNDESDIFSIMCVVCGEGLVNTVTFFWDLGG